LTTRNCSVHSSFLGLALCTEWLQPWKSYSASTFIFIWQK
jgi:hypothetical protein